MRRDEEQEFDVEYERGDWDEIPEDEKLLGKLSARKKLQRAIRDNFAT